MADCEMHILKTSAASGPKKKLHVIFIKSLGANSKSSTNSFTNHKLFYLEELTLQTQSPILMRCFDSMQNKKEYSTKFKTFVDSYMPL
jgi:hypothetical protein